MTTESSWIPAFTGMTEKDHIPVFIFRKVLTIQRPPNMLREKKVEM